MRAASEVTTTGEGAAVVQVVTERQHFETMLLGNGTDPVAWPAHLVWAE